MLYTTQYKRFNRFALYGCKSRRFTIFKKRANQLPMGGQSSQRITYIILLSINTVVNHSNSAQFYMVNHWSVYHSHILFIHIYGYTWCGYQHQPFVAQSVAPCSFNQKIAGSNLVGYNFYPCLKNMILSLLFLFLGFYNMYIHSAC